MPDRVTTSFIPKDSLTQARVEGPRSSGSPVVLINVIATFILVASVLTAGGLYVLEQALIQLTNNQITELEKLTEKFDEPTITKYERLARRITTARNLIDTHVAVSQLIPELGKYTMLNTQFTSLSLSLDPATQAYRVAVSGRASSLDTVALQADTFAKSSVITEPIVSDYAASSDGTYTFKFSALVPKDRITYLLALSKQQAAENSQQQAPETTIPDPDVQLLQ